MRLKRHMLNALILVLLLPWAASSQDFKKWEAAIAELQQWLDAVGSKGARYWIKLDSSRRPHKLYVGEGFDKADYKGKEQFVDAFSRFLSGHPEKYVLIDLYDGTTGAPIGEFGWGGFKLYQNDGQAAK